MQLPGRKTPEEAADAPPPLPGNAPVTAATVVPGRPLPEWAVRTVLQAALPDEAVEAAAVAGNRPAAAPLAQDPQSRLERTLAGQTIGVTVMREATLAIDTWVAEHVSAPAESPESTSAADSVDHAGPSSAAGTDESDSMPILTRSEPENPSSKETLIPGAQTGQAEATVGSVGEASSQTAASSAVGDGDRSGNQEWGSVPGDDVPAAEVRSPSTADVAAVRALSGEADPTDDRSIRPSQSEAVPIDEDQGDSEAEGSAPIWFSGTDAPIEAEVPVVDDADETADRVGSSDLQGGDSWAAPAFDASWAEALPVQDQPDDTVTWQPPTTATTWAEALPVQGQPDDTDGPGASLLDRQGGRDGGDRAWSSEPVGILAGAAVDLAGPDSEPSDPIGGFAEAAQEMSARDDDESSAGPSADRSVDVGLWIPMRRASHGLDGDEAWDDRDEEQELPEPASDDRAEREESAGRSWYDEGDGSQPARSQVWSLDEVVPGPRDSQDEPAARDHSDE